MQPAAKPGAGPPGSHTCRSPSLFLRCSLWKSRRALTRASYSAELRLPASSVRCGWWGSGEEGHSFVREVPVSGPQLPRPAVQGGSCRSSLPAPPGSPSQMTWSVWLGAQKSILEKCYPGGPEAGQSWPTVCPILSPLGCSRISKARSQRWPSASVTQMVAAELA